MSRHQIPRSLRVATVAENCARRAGLGVFGIFQRPSHEVASAQNAQSRVGSMHWALCLALWLPGLLAGLWPCDAINALGLAT